MALLKRFDGRLVKAMHKTADGRIKLILVNPIAGQAGEQLFVSQQDWDARGSTSYDENVHGIVGVRKLAAQGG